ncbi:IPT/TIG domain-containing protein [Flavilitoribacter nigricans]|uniref:IPT/TIG domain-containing protein n=1 Tax=Flavilitoribacter nigricans (strain ATCC 23147 / DSM 23189 / NBRC 102662 / NCIMB 1420 / SS-2) TaxID=1122177 RepID=A0A2D0N0G1_FLAN2|nr:IPT/TIG domain-containing protein [Flavilitoribacter nigricans]PHN01975.1 hypothetical protein CRP01_34280 [Flavilitoribacter nigricans DSM 23189 = NBRC 102662]
MSYTIFPRNRSLQLKPTRQPGRMLAPDRGCLEKHRIALNTIGISTISGLGGMQLKELITPSPGVVLPNIRGVISSREVSFSNAYRPTGIPGDVVRFDGKAKRLKTRPFPVRFDRNNHLQIGNALLSQQAITMLPIHTAYWVAEHLYLADNTTVVFAEAYRDLVIIAEQITIGENVTFTWAREPLAPPAAPPKAAHGQEGTRSLYLRGQGANGGNGEDNIAVAPTGYRGKDGPNIELWALNIDGQAIFDLAGQHGGQGAKGGDGGDGGRGGQGRTARLNSARFCRSGPGTGGRGGNGGKGGRGGIGGDGGDGGTLKVYAPQSILQAFDTANIFGDFSAGQGGEGGQGGQGGQAGAGGPRGAYVNDLVGNPCSGDFAHSGSAGSPGTNGAVGSSGQPGRSSRNAVRLVGISTDLFREQLQAPAIHTLSQSNGNVGDWLTLHGRNFTQTDTILFNGVACETIFSSDTTLSCQVPDVEGGAATLAILQRDGTRSNKISFVLRPFLQDVINSQNQKWRAGAKFYPGKEAAIIGTGFSEEVALLFGGHYLDRQEVQYISKNELRFTVNRSSEVAYPELLELQARLGTGETSNALSIPLWTYEIVCLGDSIVWGQGLRDEYKFTSLVERHIAEESAGQIGVYRHVYARSGANIGDPDHWNMRTQGNPNHEVPDRNPTIGQQVQLFQEAGGDPKAVRLVLLDGGINDVGVERILCNDDIRGDIESFCYGRMGQLLDRVHNTFPNAKIIVTGYFKIVSPQSDRALISLYLIGTGVSATVGAAVMVAGAGGIVAGVALSAELHDHLTDRSRVLHRQAHASLRRAIDEFNGSHAASVAFFADPEFTDEHAIFAPEALVWGVKGPPALDAADESASGGVAEDRKVLCVSAGLGGMAKFKCIRASAGHPNRAGAIRYAERILNIWNQEMNDLNEFPQNNN